MIDKRFICKTCNIEFTSKKACKTRTPKYCSSKCYGKTLEIIKNCKLCGERIINKHSASLKNRIYCSTKCANESKKNKSLPLWWRNALSEGRKKSEKCKGVNLYNWKGGAETYSDRVKIYSNNRRSALNKKIDRYFIKSLFIVQNKKCFYCECDISSYYEIEHLTPVSKGGDNDNYNLVLACRKCNSNKRAKKFEDYAIKTNPFLINKWDYIYSSALIIRDKICNIEK